MSTTKIAWNALQVALKGIERKSVKVGILESRGGNKKVGEGPNAMTLAGIGAIHEFGTLEATNAEGGQLIPARHWLSGAIRANQREFKEMQLKILKKFFQLQIKTDQAYGLLGSWAANVVKRHVKTPGAITPDIAQSTKDAKRTSASDLDISPLPLIDTGQMNNSVNYEIDNNGGRDFKGSVSVGSAGV